MDRDLLHLGVLSSRAFRTSIYANTVRVRMGFNRLPDIPGWPPHRIISLSERARRQFEAVAEAEQMARARGAVPLTVRIMLPFTRWAQRANERCVNEILDRLPPDVAAHVHSLADQAIDQFGVT